MLQLPGSDGADEATPWAIRAKVLRKLQTRAFREQVTYAIGEPMALVIGEPACDPKYPRLPSARAEAQRVAELLDPALGGQVRQLFSRNDKDAGPSALMVIGALMEQAWRIVHITGHGEPPEVVE